MEKYTIITLTHKSVGLKLIGKFVLPDQEYKEKLSFIKEKLGFTELLYLSTCNRILFFTIAENKIDKRIIKNLFSSVNPHISIFDLEEAVDKAEVFGGDNAIQHLFEVASSLDSMVIGEREILRQFRNAYDTCKKLDLTGDAIRMAINEAVITAKAVYTETKIGEKPVSIVSLAGKELLKHKINKDARFLIVGAGQTNHLMAKYLLKHQFKNFVVFNRHLKNAESLAAKLNCVAFDLKELNDFSQTFDVLISCTGSTEPVITKEIYCNLIKEDKSKKIILDLAVPNDLDKQILSDFAIHYIGLEKLQASANKNLTFRKTEVDKARQIIDAHLQEFQMIYKQRKVELAFKHIPEQIKSIKLHAVNNVFSKDIEVLDEKSKEVLEKILSYVEKKYISIPMSIARKTLVENGTN